MGLDSEPINEGLIIIIQTKVGTTVIINSQHTITNFVIVTKTVERKGFLHLKKKKKRK
jgi:hypothetical protein